MTDEQWIELGRRVRTACPQWWSAGCLTLEDMNGRTWRLVAKDAKRETFHLIQETGPRLRSPAPCVGGLIPDLRDDPTLGALRRLVVNAYSDHFVWVAPHCEPHDAPDDDEWVLAEPVRQAVMGVKEGYFVETLAEGDDYATALVNALEAKT